MEWYYASGNEQKGPVERERLRELAEIGDVKPDTLVWKEGMATWAPYKSLEPEIGGGAVAGPTGNVQKCAYSGEFRPESEMLRYGEHWVRADCKADFVASLQEGNEVGRPVAEAGSLHYVGFWWRFLAKLIDAVLFLVVLAVLIGIGVLITGLSIDGLFSGDFEDPELGEIFAIFGVFIGVFGVWFVLNCAYQTWMVGKYGATLGKLWLGFRVVATDGGSVSYMRAFGRFWAEMLHSVVLGFIGGVIGEIIILPIGIAFGGEDIGGGSMALIAVAGVIGVVLRIGIGYAGYFWAAYHKEKASLHDLLCTTRVVRRS